jgi:hypothetical protein
MRPISFLKTTMTPFFVNHDSSHEWGKMIFHGTRLTAKSKGNLTRVPEGVPEDVPEGVPKGVPEGAQRAFQREGGV